MKGSGIKLLHLWLAVLLLNLASPALCAGMIVAGVCRPAAPRQHEMSCGMCPLAAKQQENKPPDCCEIRVRDYSQNWHQGRSLDLPLEPLVAILPEPWVELPIPVRVPQVRIEEASPTCYERDVGAHQPRGPPIWCV